MDRRVCEAAEGALVRMQRLAGVRVAMWISSHDSSNAVALRDQEGQPIVVVTIRLLVALGADEDAWAGLLGHELAHHARGHADGRQNAAAASQLGADVLASIIGAVAPGVGGFVGGSVAGSITQSALYGAYTRAQEAEADALALRWMSLAGYNPEGLIRLFDALHHSSAPEFLSTHPAYDTRRQAVEAHISKHRQ